MNIKETEFSNGISKRLFELESKILGSIVDVAEALESIKELRLWEETKCESFEDYCFKRFGWKQAYVYRLISCRTVMQKVSTIVEKPLGITSYSELAKAPVEKQAKIAAEVIEACESEGREATARDFKKAVKPFVKPKKKEAVVSVPAIKPVEPSVYEDFAKLLAELKRILPHIDRSDAENIVSIVQTQFPEAKAKPATVSKEIVSQVFEHYKTHRPRAKPGDKETKLVKARIKEGYTLEELKLAIDGNYKCPHCCGDNERSREYHDLSLIFRDSDKVARFIEVAESPDSKSSGDPSWLEGIS